MFFITVYVGRGLIANDRRANALQIYLSKPLTRLEYIFGKLAILMAFLLLVTWVPAVVLLLVQVLFPGSFAFVLENLHLLPAITVFSFIQVVTVASAMLALSSLSNSSRFVGILYAGLIFFSPGDLRRAPCRHAATPSVRLDFVVGRTWRRSATHFPAAR